MIHSLTLSPLIRFTLCHTSLTSFFYIFDIRALWRSRLSTRAPECQKIQNRGLDQHGAEPFEQQQFETADIEGVSNVWTVLEVVKERAHSCLSYGLHTGSEFIPFFSVHGLETYIFACRVHWFNMSPNCIHTDYAWSTSVSLYLDSGHLCKLCITCDRTTLSAFPDRKFP